MSDGLGGGGTVRDGSAIGGGGAIRDGALALALLGALAWTGCAERGLPPGGPVDDVAPAVLLTEPADGARNVLPGAVFRITFSESMDRKSVERGLRIAPDPAATERSWQDNTFVVAITAEESLGAAGGAGAEGERVFTILRSAQDRRGNNLVEPVEIGFTGGDSLSSGEIEGKLTGETGEPRARLLLFRFPGPPLDSIAAVHALRETSPAADGAFRFRYLDASGADTLSLFALSQVEVNSEIDPLRDRIAIGPDTLVLSPAAPRATGFALTLVKPDAPGSFAGRVDSSLVGASVLLRSLADSASTFEGEVDSSGSFLVDSVPPGAYVLRLLDPSQEVESPFPDFPETLRVRPGEKRRMPGTDSLAVVPSDSLSSEGSREGGAAEGEEP
jgi:hypothetical protein